MKRVAKVEFRLRDNVGPIIRTVLTCVLLFFIYKETGPATTLALPLCAATSEVAAALWRRR